MFVLILTGFMKKINFIFLSLAFLLTSFLFVSQVEAANFKTIESLHVSENEVIAGNLYVTAVDIVIDGKIGGDLIAVAQNITINGEIAGDLIVVASDLKVNGRIEGNIRSLSNYFSFNGFVGKNITSLGDKIESGKDSIVIWDLLSFNRETILQGNIKGNLDSSAEIINLGATIEKDVNVKIANNGNGLYLSPEASVGGNLNYFNTKELNLNTEENERIKGKFVFNKIDNSKNKQREVTNVFLGIIGALLIAFLLFFGFKKTTQGVLTSVYSFKGKDLIPSFLFLIISPIIALLFFITLLGIPFSLLIIAIYFIAIYLAKVFFGLFIGDLIFKKVNKVNLEKNYFLFLSLGVVLSFIAFNLPYAGGFVSILVVLFTLSGIIKYARN